jgi:hypothetical protein
VSSAGAASAGAASAKKQTVQTSSEAFLSGINGAVGDFGQQQTAVSLEFLDANVTVSGMQDGSIYL